MAGIVYVGIAEMSISNDPGDKLMAANLGSCLGVSAYDPVEKIGGMIHCLLPTASSDPSKAAANPCMYVDTGVAKLLDELLRYGADRRRLIIIAAGCGQMNDRNGVFEIGKKNFVMFRKVLWSKNMLLKADDTGGENSRTVSLDIRTGEVWLRTQGQQRRLF